MRNEETNDELLYDPDLDVENEKWIEKERQKYRVKKGWQFMYFHCIVITFWKKLTVSLNTLVSFVS